MLEVTFKDALTAMLVNDASLDALYDVKPVQQEDLATRLPEENAWSLLIQPDAVWSNRHENALSEYRHILF